MFDGGRAPRQSLNDLQMRFTNVIKKCRRWQLTTLAYHPLVRSRQPRFGGTLTEREPEHTELARSRYDIRPALLHSQDGRNESIGEV